MNNLALRSITGLLFGIVMVSSTFANLWIQCIVFGLFMIQALIEFYGLALKRQDPSLLIGTSIGGLIYFILCLIKFDTLESQSVVLLLPLILIYSVIELWRKSNNPLENFSIYVLGICYITLPMYLLVELSQQKLIGFPLSLGMLALIWTNDTMAYFTGMLLGKHKLFERISPKKTWEGTVGGVLATISVAWLIGNRLDESHLIFWIISGALISLTSIFGDLIESLFKRSAEVKDSGNILPGHGGVLDRFDAVLLSAPFFYCWFKLYFN